VRDCVSVFERACTSHLNLQLLIVCRKRPYVLMDINVPTTEVHPRHL